MSAIWEGLKLSEKCDSCCVPCGTFNIVNTGGRVRDVAPPQMCQSQSHHVTLGMTIGRSPRGEGPDRPRDRERGETRRETHWEDSRPTPAAELVGGGSNSTGARQGRWARIGPGSGRVGH